MYRQSVRNDYQVTTPVIYTHSGTIRRTQGQSLLSGSHRKNQDEVSTMAGMTLLLIGGGTNLSINTKIKQQYTQVFVLVGVL